MTSNQAPSNTLKLDVRIAKTSAEIEAAQRLRYHVFYEGMGATPTEAIQAAQRDFDHFDHLCDHLIVTETDLSNGLENVLGTYRLLRGNIAGNTDAFYSATEFDLSALNQYPGEVMELGRSCVNPEFRNKPIMQYLWRGIADYIRRYDVGLMFGCASFPGTDVTTMAHALSYLHHNHAAPKQWRPRALDHRFQKMKMLSKSCTDSVQALRELPPLIKGYLRLGGVVGRGAVIDDQFKTVDVCLLLETVNVTQRYQRHYLDKGAENTIQTEAQC